MPCHAIFVDFSFLYHDSNAVCYSMLAAVIPLSVDVKSMFEGHVVQERLRINNIAL